jgi:hypothetical protein
LAGADPAQTRIAAFYSIYQAVVPEELPADSEYLPVLI